MWMDCMTQLNRSIECVHLHEFKWTHMSLSTKWHIYILYIYIMSLPTKWNMSFVCVYTLYIYWKSQVTSLPRKWHMSFCLYVNIMYIFVETCHVSTNKITRVISFVHKYYMHVGRDMSCLYQQNNIGHAVCIQILYIIGTNISCLYQQNDGRHFVCI